MTRAIVPVSQLARRLPEAGRLRFGIKQGKNPKAIETWRLTSHDETAIRAVAEIYGGTPTPWTDAPTPGQWQVITTSAELAIVLPPGDPLGGTPIYEQWSAGGCQRRCDGEVATVMIRGPEGPEPDHVPCICTSENARACEPRTRLNVILPDVRFGGTWRLDSQSWNVAHEMPGMVEMIQSLQSRGLTRALLCLEQRKSVSGSQTRRFVLPVLRLDHTPEQLHAGAAALGAGSGAPLAALPAASPSPVDADDEAVEAELVDDPPQVVVDEAERAAMDAHARGRSEDQPPEREPLPGDEDPVAAVRELLDRFGPRGREWIASVWRERKYGSLNPRGSARKLTADEAPEVLAWLTSVWDDAKNRSRRVVMACKEAGLTDDNERHALVRYATADATSSSKDITAAELQAILEAAKAVEKGDLALGFTDDGEAFLAPAEAVAS